MSGQCEHLCDFCEQAYPTEVSLHTHQLTEHIVSVSCQSPLPDKTENDSEKTTVLDLTSQDFENDSKGSDRGALQSHSDSKLSTGAILTYSECNKVDFDDSAKDADITDHDIDDYVTNTDGEIDSEGHLSDVSDVCSSTSGENTDRKEELRKRRRRRRKTTGSVRLSELTCSFCGKVYSSSRRQLYHAHVCSHTGETPFECHICSKGFAANNTLIAHVKRVHEGIKPQTQCNICGKIVMKANIGRHMESHTGQRRYSCDFCAKSYTRKTRLSEHLLTHSNTKPFSCDVCGREFTRKYLLTEHRNGHTGERPHRCQLCPERFQRSQALLEHNKTVHRGEVYTENDSGEIERVVNCFECSICGEKFAYKCRLKQHMESHKLQMDRALQTKKRRHHQNGQSC